MSRTENVELTVLCLIHNEKQYLLQDRISEDWKGYDILVCEEFSRLEYHTNRDTTGWIPEKQNTGGL